jgi:PTS system cellobiose-specific IIB component
MKILIVCGAGASSTFVALRMRASITALGLDATVTVGSDADLPGSLAGVDVLLVGAHLGSRFDEIAAQAAALGVAAGLMPASAFTATSGDDALQLALTLHSQRRPSTHEL